MVLKARKDTSFSVVQLWTGEILQYSGFSRTSTLQKWVWATRSANGLSATDTPTTVKIVRVCSTRSQAERYAFALPRGRCQRPARV